MVIVVTTDMIQNIKTITVQNQTVIITENLQTIRIHAMNSWKGDSMKKHSNKKCKSCKYIGQKQAVNGCDYIIIIGHMRGCTVKDCDKYEKGKRMNCSTKWRDGSFL